MGFKLVPLIALCVLVVGNVLHIVGLATPEWVTGDVNVLFTSVTVTRGLWEGCTGDSCDAYDEDDKTDWLRACEAMAILGMLVGCLAAFLAALIFVRYLMKKDVPKNVGLITLATAIFSFIFILICVIVYAVKMKEGDSSWDFGYSFGLAIAGAILIVVGGSLAFAGSQ